MVTKQSVRLDFVDGASNLHVNSILKQLKESMVLATDLFFDLVDIWILQGNSFPDVVNQLLIRLHRLFFKDSIDVLLCVISPLKAGIIERLLGAQVLCHDRDHHAGVVSVLSGHFLCDGFLQPCQVL